MMVLGSESVVIGPGDIREAHRTGEFVPVDELERCAEILKTGHRATRADSARPSNGALDMRLTRRYCARFRAIVRLNSIGTSMYRISKLSLAFCQSSVFVRASIRTGTQTTHQ